MESSILHLNVQLDTNLATSLLYAIVFVICIIANAGTLIKIIKMRRTGSLAASKKVEIRLFIISVWMLGTLLVLILNQMSWDVGM
jgi:hypothetical protein